MSGTVSAIIEGNDFSVYSAPYDAGNDLPPPDDVEFGENWNGHNGNWQLRGFTVDGVTATITTERGALRVDQVLDPVLRPLQRRDVTLSTQLAEVANIENVALAAGIGTTQSTLPGSGTKGYDDFIINAEDEDDTFYSWGFEVEQQDGEPFRGIIYKGLAVGNPALAFQRNDQAVVVPVEIAANVDGTRLARFRTTIPASS